jgi:hypothetical protein
MYNSANYLPPYLQQQPIFKDLCFFIDYLELDIDEVYNDLRYKYIDWSKVSEEGVIEIFRGMGMDYIIDLINVITPSNSSQLLGLASLLWLLKGQLLGVDILADICGFKYEYTVWHEQIPLGTPNTATMTLTFIKNRELSEDFQYNFVEFLRKYLYPVITVTVNSPVARGYLYTYGYMIGQEHTSLYDVDMWKQKYTIEVFDDLSGIYDNTYNYDEYIKLKTNTKWTPDENKWAKDAYYSFASKWTSPVKNEGVYTSQIYDTQKVREYRVSIITTCNCLHESSYTKTLWRYSSDNVQWTEWEEFSGMPFIFLRYCQFKVEFYAPEGRQILLSSVKATLLYV